jgi:hypothetical protein
MKKKLFLFTTVLFSISSFAQIPTSGLIYNYEFSKSYNDNGSSGNHGINHGSTFRRDRCFIDSNAVTFDGVNDYVNLGSMDSLDLIRFSMSLWFKSSSNKSNFESIVKVLNGVSGNNTAFSLEINRGSGTSYTAGNLGFFLRDINGKALSLVVNDASINDCEWHNVIWVVDSAATNNSHIYLDGSLRNILPGYSAQGPRNFIGFQYDLLLGAANNRGTIQNYFKGSLDDVLFYDRSLSAAEALQLFNTSCPELKCHDTTFVQDTTFVNDTITEVTLDTVLIYTIDTLYQTVYDTTSITSYDTITQIVYDTTTITSYDTIYTTYTIAVEDTLIVNRYTDNCGNVLHKIYPNPTKDYLYLSSNGPDCFEGYKVQFIDALGKILETKPYGNVVTFDIRGYARSLYFLRLIGPAGDAIFSEKIILD